MDRRTFLRTSTAAAAATTAAAGAAEAATFRKTPTSLYDPGNEGAHGHATVQAQHALTIALPAGTALADTAFRLARHIAIATGERVRLELAGEGDISADAADGTFGYLPEICGPAFALFTGLPSPLAVSPADLLAWHASAGGSLFLDEAAAQRDLKVLIAGHSGPGIGLWSDRPLMSLTDFAAADIRAIGLGGTVAGEIRQAFSGSFPGAEHPAGRIIEIAAQPIEAYADVPVAARGYWYRDGLHDQGMATALVVKRSVWERLSTADQCTIEAIAEAIAHRSLADARVAGRLMAPSIIASLPLKRLGLPVDVASQIHHTALDVTYAAMQQNAVISRAFQAYAAYFAAMMGHPLTTARKTVS